ncbi:MAG: nitroreductase family protein [Chloroflexi bacterium]|nr:nitroreductase family protein [Chloroflexota bacterium]
MKYDELLELIKYRRSIRRFKPDLVPDEYITKILDAAHYAMSGGNSQPWEFIVVKDPETKGKIFNIYREHDQMMVWYLEQQRIPRYRHPAFNLPDEEEYKHRDMIAAWKDAPVLICLLEDPRKQYGSTLCRGLEFGPNLDVLAATMGHVSMLIHLAAASLGLGSQRMEVMTQEPYRQILKYPEPLHLDTLVPVGYRAYEPGPPHRLPLKELVHYGQYDMKKYMRNEDFLKYIEKIRELGRPGYRVAIGEEKG